MLVPPNQPQYSTPINTMVSVLNRMNPRLTTHYLEFLLSHMSGPNFFWLGNLPMVKIHELATEENPPAWVPMSFIQDVVNIRTRYGSMYL
jgi:hypothetical protein